MSKRYTHTGQTPSPEGKAPRRWEFEGFDGIAADDDSKEIDLVPAADLISGKTYIVQSFIAGQTGNYDTYIRHQGIGYGWGGTGWSGGTDVMLYDGVGNSSGWGDGDCEVSFVGGTAPEARIALRLTADKDYNAYFWWRVTVIEVDTSAPLLP
jgi:hypothetical protein